MEEFFEAFSDPESLDLIRRYEKMLDDKEHVFFDVDEFEEIIDYFFIKNDMKMAMRAINEALDQHPNAPSVILKKAQLFIQTGKDAKALLLLKETEVLDTSDFDLFMLKGSLYSQLGKFEKAIAEYKRAVRECDELDEIYTSIAFEYENLGKYEKAIDFLILALERNPQNEAACMSFHFAAK